MKPRFEEHEGQLFRMLDEPVPLTPDAEFPCLVRLIQDDSPMGRNNKNRFPSYLEQKFIIKELDDGKYIEIEKWFFPAHNSRFEIIGYPVEEGSRWWALYKMMQGKKVSYKGAIGNVYWALNQDGNVQYYDMDNLAYIGTIRSKLEFGKKDVVKTGWQLYKEPKPEQQNPMPTTEFVDLSDAPAGWICKTRDGGNYPLKYIEVSPTRYAYEDKSGLTVYVMANGHYKKNGTDGRDIIACEPEQPKYKVGDWVEIQWDDNSITHEQIVKVRQHEFLFQPNERCCYTAIQMDTMKHESMNIRCIRKLSPSEVIVHIGCMSGTVVFTDADRFILRGIGNSEMANACIMFKMLDAATCVLVESLLKAQDEDK